MPRGHGQGGAFSARTPHFFKIILEETLQEKRLLIPKKFVRLYGDTLSSSVSVKLPCGSEWIMKLTKNEGQVWLGKGWTKFAEHYSIVRGHMLSFQYEGNSKFEAVIFDTSTVEIDYPFVPRNIDESDIDYKRKLREDNSIESSDDFSACPRTQNESQSPCSRPWKRLRTSPLARTQIKLSHDKPKGSCHSKTVIQNSERKGDSPSSKLQRKGKRDPPSIIVSRKCSTTSRKISETIRGMKTLDRTEKTAAFEKSCGFTSDRPFFKVVMQPYYVHSHVMNFPASFARRYLKNKSENVILKVRNGRKTWPMKHRFLIVSGNGKSYARFCCGWKEFSRDNNLEVGDVCVFVLLKGTTVSIEVVIFRVNGNSTPPDSSARVNQHDKASTANVAIKKGPSIPSSCDDLPEKHDNRMSIFHKTSLEPDGNERQQQALSPMEKTMLLGRARFVSEKPFFKVVVQPSYTRTHMPIPLDILDRYFKNEGNIVLWVPNVGSWFVGLKIWRLKSGRLMAEFCNGWKKFAKENDLKVGDVCIFEHVDGTEIKFEVSIVRIPDNDAYHQRSRALWDPKETESESYGATNNETSTPSSRENLRLKQAGRYMSTSGKTSLKATTKKKAATVVEKNKFLERAHFESQKPFFKVVIQPSYAGAGYHMPVPNDFAQKYIKKDGDAILHIPNRTRTWSARLRTRRLISGRIAAEISNGWKEFAEGNKLQVGDVCIFELTNETEIWFEVSIVRAALNDMPRGQSQAGDSSTCLDKSKVYVGVKTEVD